MIVPAAIQRTYDDWQRFLQEVANRVEGTLAPFCRDNGFVFEGRVKSLESLAEKVESGRYASWDSLDDLYACTVAVPLSTDETVARDFLHGRFDVLAEKERGSIPKSPDVFRFDSTRVVAKLRALPDTPEESGPSVFSVKFEIQIKSLLEFAWAKTTHALTYKSTLVDWKRYRLSAHLKAVVEQADFLLAGFEGAAQLVPDGWCPELDDKSILRELFESLAQSSQLPTELIPKDWSRFIDNLYVAVQVLTGHHPTSHSRRSLQFREQICVIVKEYFATRSVDDIPRSLSLFQIVLGVLCTSGMFTGQSNNYHILTDDAFAVIFPGVNLPGKTFSTQS